MPVGLKKPRFDLFGRGLATNIRWLLPNLLEKIMSQAIMNIPVSALSAMEISRVQRVVITALNNAGHNDNARKRAAEQAMEDEWRNIKADRRAMNAFLEGPLMQRWQAI
jgi:hypothetical protein